MHDQTQIPGSVPPLPNDAASHYVYLLVSSHKPAFKLGFTRSLALRLGSLRSGHGEFSQDGSFVLRVGSRRTAREIEASLKAHFADAMWRATAPTPSPLRGCSDVGGHTEWYAIRAFVPMLATLVSLLQKSRVASSGNGSPLCGRAPGGMSLAQALREPASIITPDDSFIEMPKHQSKVCDAGSWLDYSEANFAFVRAWVEARRDRLVSITPPMPKSRSDFRRTLVFRAVGNNACERQTDSATATKAEWFDLCAHASVWLRARANFMCRSYFYCEYTLPDSGKFAVGFRFTPFFQSSPERFTPHTDLPRRICQWAATL